MGGDEPNLRTRRKAESRARPPRIQAPDLQQKAQGGASSTTSQAFQDRENVRLAWNRCWRSEQYKTKMLVDGQTHPVLIREEAGAPDAKLSGWVVAVISIFGLEDESSSPWATELPSWGRMRRFGPGSGWDPRQDQCSFSSNGGGPEGGSFAQTATTLGCLQVPAQLSKPFSPFNSCSQPG